jgi:predicted AAA+ superfamily ATPase
VAVLGPRQAGKSTFAKQLAAEWPANTITYFDLEDPAAEAQLADPRLALSPLRGLVVLDEIQRHPELFPLIRVLADRPGVPAQFLVLGSASPELLRQSSETLAGRIAYSEIGPFDLGEIAEAQAHDRQVMDLSDVLRLWRRGGLPRSFLAGDEAASFEWRRQFVRTFLERDLPMLGVRTPPEVMRRFWSMISHWNGQVWNAAELSRSLGVSRPTVDRYLDVLCSTFMVQRLLPWHTNAGKREVKAPKVFVADSGLLHAILNLREHEDLLGHPKAGASWEGFAIRQIVRRLAADERECFFWALHSGGELDLLVLRGRVRRGFEIKLTQSPRVTVSMRNAMEALQLDSLDVVHAGPETYPMSERVRALSLLNLERDLERL